MEGAPGDDNLMTLKEACETVFREGTLDHSRVLAFRSGPPRSPRTSRILSDGDSMRYARERALLLLEIAKEVPRSAKAQVLYLAQCWITLAILQDARAKRWTSRRQETVAAEK